MDKIRTKLMLISGLAFLRPLLRDAGFDTDEGLVLLFDTSKIARQFFAACTECLNATEVGSLKKDVTAENYQAGFHICRPSDDPDLLEDFLLNKDFLPVVISGGQIPTCLEEPYIIRISSEPFNVIIYDFFEEFDEFADYVIENTETVVERLETVDISRFLQVSAVGNEDVLILQTFLAVGVIWDDFIQSVTPSQEFFEDFFLQCAYMVKKMRDFFDHIDMKDEISDMFFQYLEDHPEIKISHANEVTSVGLNAIEACKAILYDTDFYYIPERLVKKICEPLLATKSLGTLKKQLAGEGIIERNSDGYTVKKKFWTVYGNSDRMRAIKFKKEALLSREGLNLEEFFCDIDESDENGGMSCI